MELVKGEIMPRRTLDAPHILRYSAVLLAGLRGIHLKLNDVPYLVIRKPVAALEAEERIDGIIRNEIDPVRPFSVICHDCIL